MFGSHNWLGEPTLALISVIAHSHLAVDAVRIPGAPCEARLAPPDIYEAARIDRAGAWHRFRHITLPLIRPAIMIVVIMRVMMALSAFAAIFAAPAADLARRPRS